MQITMPSGSAVTARHSCFSPDDCLLDIAVYPLVEDAGYSEGLCGNYNGNKNDDKLPKGSSNVDTDSEPVIFAASYMYVANNRNIMQIVLVCHPLLAPSLLQGRGP